MFYFITFIVVVRWCNLRVKPKRETRGVSRSKCADLITACVPVSWAASIIISETVDATDYYDGFGTGEIVVGIRAYQWGWEYFYPKNIDINYNLRMSYSTLVGKSLRYSTTSTTTTSTNELWKYYQKKNCNTNSVTPGMYILAPIDNAGMLGNLDFANIGHNISKDYNAFYSIQKHSKLSSFGEFMDLTNLNSFYPRFTNLYANIPSRALSSISYYSSRQHMYSPPFSFLSSFSSLLDPISVDKYFHKLTGTSTFTNKFSEYTFFHENKLPTGNLTSSILPVLTKFLSTQFVDFKSVLYPN